MRKLLTLLAGLALSAGLAFAQDRAIDLEDLEEFNKFRFGSGSRVEAKLEVAFPMYFGNTVLTNINYKGEWAPLKAMDFLDMNVRKSFVFGLEVASVHIKSAGGPFEASLGARWTFMDYTFANSAISMEKVGGICVPYYILAAGYDGRKSKIHANYFGVPLRLALNYSRFTVYVGGSAEVLVGSYTKYKFPKTRQEITGLFNRFRATVEGGFSYGNLGLYVQYGLTPVFSEMLSDARSVTIGILLGL